jgi:glutamate racemase
MTDPDRSQFLKENNSKEFQDEEAFNKVLLRLKTIDSYIYGCSERYEFIMRVKTLIFLIDYLFKNDHHLIDSYLGIIRENLELLKRIGHQRNRISQDTHFYKSKLFGFYSNPKVIKRWTGFIFREDGSSYIKIMYSRKRLLRIENNE